MIATTCPSAMTSSSLTRIALILPAVVDVTGISIFIASMKAISSPSPTLPPVVTGKRAHAAGDFGDDLDVWHFRSPGGPSDGLVVLVNGFLLWPQISPMVVCSASGILFPQGGMEPKKWDDARNGLANRECSPAIWQARVMIQVVSRAFDVLRCFEGHEARLGNLEISSRCGLPRSTVSRLTRTLTRMGQLVYLPRDQKYRIGPSAVAMSTSMMKGLQLRNLIQAAAAGRRRSIAGHRRLRDSRSLSSGLSRIRAGRERARLA